MNSPSTSGRPSDLMTADKSQETPRAFPDSIYFSKITRGLTRS